MRTTGVQVYTGTDKPVHINTEDPFIKDNQRRVNVTASYKACAFDTIHLDASSELITLTLPDEPKPGDKIEMAFFTDREFELIIDVNKQVTLIPVGQLHQIIHITDPVESLYFRVLYTGEEWGWILVGMG